MANFHPVEIIVKKMVKKNLQTRSNESCSNISNTDFFKPQSGISPISGKVEHNISLKLFFQCVRNHGLF